jgi:endoglucanase
MYAKLGDVTNDDAEYWHNNGNKLKMEYKADMTQDQLKEALMAATGNETKSDQQSWDVKYYEGWDAWKKETIPAKTWTTYAWEFYIDDALMENVKSKGGAPDGKGTVEWTFHFGGDGKFTEGGCFKANTIIKFDNLMMIDMDSTDNDYKAPDKPAPVGLVVNQCGYFPGMEKKATLMVEKGASPVKWEISGPESLSGTASATTYEEHADEYCQIIDFTAISKPGKYTLKADGKSVEFNVGEDVYGNLLGDSLNYFYLNRSGIDIEAAYIQNGGKNKEKSALARKAGHKPDTAYVADEWVPLYKERKNSEMTSKYSEKIDGSKGWYDAGDYGKYVVNGGVSMWTLANAYERSPEKYKEGAKFINIPESGNGTPDILDELKWEADFFLNMTRKDGFVYHKLHDYKWTALGVMPYLEEGADENVTFPTRIVKPVTYAATLNSAAALAQLGRLLEKAGDKDASKYIEQAKASYKAAKDDYVKKYGSIYKQANDATDLGKQGDPSKFAPLDQNKGGGPYGDTQVTDEFYWAACELYVTTGDSEYYKDLSGSEDFAFKVITNLVGGENQGSPTTFTWGTLSSLGTASLALNMDNLKDLTDAQKKTIIQQFQEAGDFYLEVQEKDQFGSNYKGCTYDATVTDIDGDEVKERSVTLTGGYEWGSNSMVINNAMIQGLAYDLTKDGKYLDGVAQSMDYILGRNPIENSYITGYGVDGKTTENPHHRYWCHKMKNDWPYCPNGCLSGGPNSNMNDPMIQGAGYKIGELAPMKCYYDDNDAWSVNEITINWNSPVVWVASFMDDYKDVDTRSGEKPTESNKPAGKAVWGDANEDGKVDVLDVVVTNKHILGVSKLSDQGYVNVDIDESDSITSADSLNVLKLALKLLKATDCPVK